REFPTPAPPERSEPHPPMFLVRVSACVIARINRKPRVRLMARRAAPALDLFNAWMNIFLDKLRLARPPTGQIAQPVTVAARQSPHARLRALHHQRLPRAVLNRRMLLDDPLIRIH